MSYNLVINGSNVVNTLKNTYRYDFINGTFEIAEGSEIMITSLQIPYSWFNITTRNNNNAFRFHWPSTVVQSITLTNGGSGYQTAPSVQIVGANTTQATATCTIAGPVSSFTITAGGTGDDPSFIVLTETKFSFRCIPVWDRYSPHRTRVEKKSTCDNALTMTSPVHW
jgi:hypothetical protein